MVTAAKVVLALVALAALSWGFFVVPLGDKTLYQHCHEVYRSDTVQNKLTHIAAQLERRAMQDEPKKKPLVAAKPALPSAARAKPEATKPAREHLGPEDRAALDRLLQAR